MVSISHPVVDSSPIKLSFALLSSEYILSSSPQEKAKALEHRLHVGDLFNEFPGHVLLRQDFLQQYTNPLVRILL